MNSTLNDAILADILDELGRVQKAAKALPRELQEATFQLTTATEAARNHAGELQKTAETVVSASVESTKVELSKMVANAAEKIAVNKSRKEMTVWVVGCLFGAFALFAGFGVYFLDTGVDIGYKKGVAEAQLSQEYQNRAFAWSESTEGKMAKDFAELGVLRDLYTCDNPGWMVEWRPNKAGKTSRFCIPKPDKEGKAWGWQLP
jgi:hypothetical protein